jgi:hypothetical protein
LRKEPYGTDGVRGERVLVVANEAVSGDELRQSLISHLGDRRGRAFVVAPALATTPTAIVVSLVLGMAM